jgi:signal transduction histidine kinase
VTFTPTSAEVRDDGQADYSSDDHGYGLAGLRERAAELAATVETRELSPGFSLSVVR